MRRLTDDKIICAVDGKCCYGEDEIMDAEIILDKTYESMELYGAEGTMQENRIIQHSDDEGKTWTFDRWVLTAETVCFTEMYNPGAGNVMGQKAGDINLGSGEFSIFIEPDGEYIYLYYNIIHVDTNEACWTRCDTYVARTRERTDGIMGDFVKYYDGAFCEAGNFGKETPIIHNSWHPRMVYSKKYDYFIITSSPVNFGNNKQLIADYMELRTSKDMLNWSEPITVERDGKLFGNH